MPNTKQSKPAPEGAQLAFETVIKLDFSQISPNPWQIASRLEPAPERLERLVASIRAHGLIQTPVVRRRPDGKYEMAAGWGRLCAYRTLAERTRDITWCNLPVVIRELSDQQMSDMVWEENEVRAEMGPIDRALYFERYIKDFGVTQTELARRRNISQSEVANTLRLLKLSGEVQGMVISQEITESHARCLLQLEGRSWEEQLEYARRAKEMTVAQLDAAIKRLLGTEVKHRTLQTQTVPLTETQTDVQTHEIITEEARRHFSPTTEDKEVTDGDARPPQPPARVREPIIQPEKKPTTTVDQGKPQSTKVDESKPAAPVTVVPGVLPQRKVTLTEMADGVMVGIQALGKQLFMKKYPDSLTEFRLLEALADAAVFWQSN